MSAAKHTPGPWVAHGFAPSILVAPEHEILAPVATVHDQPKADELRANARLISAAPELLEACETAVPALELCLKITELVEGQRLGSGLLDQVHAAIARARGGK